MATVVNAVKVIIELVPSSSQTDLKMWEQSWNDCKYFTQNGENIFLKNNWGSRQKKDMDLCEFRGGHKDDQRAGVLLLWGMAERAVFSLEKEVSRESLQLLPVPRGVFYKIGEVPFKRAGSDNPITLNWKRGGSYKMLGRNFWLWGW